MDELSQEELARIKKTHGCSPRLYLQCKGPGDAGWCNIGSQGYDTVENKRTATVLLQKHRDRWEAQGYFADHVFRIISVADLVAS